MPGKDYEQRVSVDNEGNFLCEVQVDEICHHPSHFSEKTEGSQNEILLKESMRYNSDTLVFFFQNKIFRCRSHASETLLNHLNHKYDPDKSFTINVNF